MSDTNVNSWLQGILSAVEVRRTAVKEVTRATISDLIKDFVQSSPVVTGRLRSSWRVVSPGQIMNAAMGSDAFSVPLNQLAQRDMTKSFDIVNVAKSPEDGKYYAKQVNDTNIRYGREIPNAISRDFANHAVDRMISYYWPIQTSKRS